VKTLRSHLEEFITMRADEIGNIVSSRDEEYRAKSKRLQLLFHEILQCLPEPKQSELFQYEELANERASKLFAILYRQGLVDGMYIIDEISERKNSIFFEM